MGVFTVGQALQMAMQIEKQGEVYYRASAARAADSQVQDVFRELAHQEQLHHVAFQTMRDRLGGAADAPALADDEYGNYLQATLENHLFIGADVALAVAKKAEDAELALQGAIGFEKDTLLFYYDLRDIMDEDDRGVLTNIIGEEKSHVQKLASMLG